MYTYMSVYSSEYVCIPLNTKMTQVLLCGILSPARKYQELYLASHLYSYHTALTPSVQLWANGAGYLYSS